MSADGLPVFGSHVSRSTPVSTLLSRPQRIHATMYSSDGAIAYVGSDQSIHPRVATEAARTMFAFTYRCHFGSRFANAGWYDANKNTGGSTPLTGSVTVMAIGAPWTRAMTSSSASGSI